MSKHSEQFELKNDVRVFADHSTAEDATTQNRLDSLVRDAAELGCVEALSKHNHNIRYLTDEVRSKYIEFLNIQSDETVLEIGASMGQHSRLIAKKCQELHTIEVVPEQAMFAKLWCEQSGCDNVRISAGGASGALPYESDTFDLVIFNYVLEWCAGRASGKPEKFHADLLAEIQRLLRPGGRLYVSTKNRFAIRYVLGSRDEHLGYRFGSALPRWVTRKFASSNYLDIPGGYLHSRRGIKKLLREAGFSDLQAILCFPDARFPQFIENFNAAGIAKLGKAKFEDISRKEKIYLALPSAMKRTLAPSHVYLAVKP